MDSLKTPPESGPLVRQCRRCHIPNWHTNLDAYEHCPFCADDLRIAKHFRDLATMEQDRVIQNLPHDAKKERKAMRKKLEVSDIVIKLNEITRLMSKEEKAKYLESIGLFSTEGE